MGLTSSCCLFVGVSMVCHQPLRALDRGPVNNFGLSVAFEYQGQSDCVLGYTMQDGDILYNPIIDRDNVSLSVVYSF